ncbi:MAG: NAD-dependent epimerase/dehydratase family protein [Actinobacteria bacterium]|nr:NAD-dependent epimerase/dehydratase family protein [Actinomycetota bacterium]
MRVVVIGGTGHVGTYLVPFLVEAGYEVIVLNRGKTDPYISNSAWTYVRKIYTDREDEEQKGNFGKFVNNLKPDIVIDMICFNIESAKQLVEALRDNVTQFISCGSIWVYGNSTEVPTTEDQFKKPLEDYGINKAKIEEYLLREAHCSNFPATVLHPGHIVGPGWIPVNPAGNLNTDIFSRLARGEEIKLPNIGMETLHHVHAEDVARIFMLAIKNWKNSVGESFNVVSPKALTLRGYAEKVASWFGKNAVIEYLPWEKWSKTSSSEDVAETWEHISHSPNCSIEKAKKILDYHPHYSSLEAIHESVNWLISNGIIKI